MPCTRLQRPALLEGIPPRCPQYGRICSCVPPPALLQLALDYAMCKTAARAS
jgi:hypothetical protein